MRSYELWKKRHSKKVVFEHTLVRYWRDVSWQVRQRKTLYHFGDSRIMIYVSFVGDTALIVVPNRQASGLCILHISVLPPRYGALNIRIMWQVIYTRRFSSGTTAHETETHIPSIRSKMKLFPATASLRFVSIDTVGPLPKTSNKSIWKPNHRSVLQVDMRHFYVKEFVSVYFKRTSGLIEPSIMHTSVAIDI